MVLYVAVVVPCVVWLGRLVLVVCSYVDSSPCVRMMRLEVGWCTWLVYVFEGTFRACQPRHVE